MNSAANRLRAILHGERCVAPASVFDALSARAAEELGFEALFLAGSVASLAVLGEPDLNLLTLTELAGLVRRICRASPLPLIVDADHGYGNALNVRRTVDELASAGAAGITLEDTVLPQPFGSPPMLTSIAEGERKLAAALEARGDREIAIFARTSALMSVGLDAACARIRAYAATGVDGVFAVGARTRAELAAVAQAAGGLPQLAYNTGGEVSPGAELASLGVRLLIVGHAPFASGVQAAHAALAGQCGATLPTATATELVGRLSHAGHYADLARRFLSPEGQ